MVAGCSATGNSDHQRLKSGHPSSTANSASDEPKAGSGDNATDAASVVPTEVGPDGPGAPVGGNGKGDADADPNGSSDSGSNSSGTRSPTTARPTAPSNPGPGHDAATPTFGPVNPMNPGVGMPPSASLPPPTAPPLRSQVTSTTQPPSTAPVTSLATGAPPVTSLPTLAFGCEVNLFLGGSPSQPLVTLAVTEANRDRVWVVLEWAEVSRLIELNLSGGKGSSVQLAPQWQLPVAWVYGADTGRREDLGCVSAPS